MVRAFKFLRSGGNRKPAVPSGGSPEPAGSVSSEKDETTMAVTALKFKATTTPEQQLAEWIERGKREVFTVTTMLTPELARLLLANNPNNRPPQWGRNRGTRSIAAYAAMMARGEWMLNGSTLVVASSGELNDGQHRCEAAILAEAAVPVQIVFGVERATRATLDQGIARTGGNVLAMEGVKDANNVAVYLRFRIAVARGGHPSTTVAPDELLSALNTFAPFESYTVPIKGWASRNKLSNGFMVGAHAICAEANPLAAQAYADQVATGVGLATVNAPAARFRKLVEDIRLGRVRRTPYELAAHYVVGFNNFCRGRTGPLGWRDKDVREPFPTPVRA